MSDKIKLWCWVKNDDFDEATLLPVHMTSSDTISILKQAIARLLSENIGVMKLWKVGKLYSMVWFKGLTHR